MKGYRDDVPLPKREGQASREGCRRNIVPSWKERWSIRRFIVASSANPWRKGENKKRVNCPRDERTVFGRVAGARRRARRGEQKGRISSSTASPLHLGRRTRASEAAFNDSTLRVPSAPYGVTNFYNRRAQWTRKIVRSVKLRAWGGPFPDIGIDLPRFSFEIRLESSFTHPLLLTFATTRCSQSWA